MVLCFIAKDNEISNGLQPISQHGKEKAEKHHIQQDHLFNLYAEYMMRNTGLDEAQAVIKIAWRNINNLRY